jgi:nucleotide-binding universal stress UspA family protein
MFQKILFASSATPACDPAARVAFALARQYHSNLTVFHVLGVPTRGFSQEVVDVRTGEKVEADDEYISWVREEIKTHYAKQLEEVPEAAIEVAIGIPHREILRKARSEPPDLIIMGGSTGSSEHSVYKKLMVGSTLHRVAKVAVCPVLAVGRPAGSFWGGFSSIVFGTDFSKASDAAFDFAYQMAKQINGDLHLFHALDIRKLRFYNALDIGNLEFGGLLDQDTIEKRLREARQRIRGRYAARMEGFKNYSIEVWEGIPFIEIVKFAREKQADLIVLAHHSQPEDTDETRISSNMEQVIVRANCPVISVNRASKAE